LTQYVGYSSGYCKKRSEERSQSHPFTFHHFVKLLPSPFVLLSLATKRLPEKQLESLRNAVNSPVGTHFAFWCILSSKIAAGGGNVSGYLS